MNQTDSQLTLKYVMTKYPCLQSWLDFVNLHAPHVQQFDSASCSQIALISRAAMKTLDYIADIEPSSSVIRVSRMLFSMQEMAWRCWTGFSAQVQAATETRTLRISSVALEALAAHSKWDIAFNRRPSEFDPSELFNVILKGATV